MVSYQVFIERLADWFMQLFLDPGYFNDTETEASGHRVIAKTKKVIIGLKKPILEFINDSKEESKKRSKHALHNCQDVIRIVPELMVQSLCSQALMARWLY
ncbi:hypothetical protein KEM09_12170 [Carboxylicivirga mesophila]|uniref:Uncharacterized protein n=1 Tax=Carboxylicivirga mesophila TaxID=1166478 RepID=A0ABS5KB15_9BACT|nr:hypothetical protein [Carboxylicivirga mesophila]MBS2212166.1 hypothetical protein [Carboxylicivirga mesophila]